MAEENKAYAAICKVNAEIAAIGKDRYNAFQKYKFRGIDDFYAMLHPLLVKHGLFIGINVLDERSEEFESAKGTRTVREIIRVEYSLIADDGSRYSAVVVGEGIDTSDKAMYKALSGAQKYFFVQVFTIPTDESKDPEDEHVDVKRKKPDAGELYKHCLKAMDALHEAFPDDYNENAWDSDKTYIDECRKNGLADKLEIFIQRKRELYKTLQEGGDE